MTFDSNSYLGLHLHPRVLAGSRRAHVFAAGAPQSDGTVLVDRILGGKDGVFPPM